MIKITYQGRLGNNLFQYGRGLVESYKTNDCVVNPPVCATAIFKPQINSKFIKVNKVEYTDYFQTEETVKLFNEYNKKLFYSNLPNLDGIFIHCRLGDMLNHQPWSINYAKKIGLRYTNKYLPIDYYDAAIESITDKPSLRIISSDTPNHEIVDHIVKKHNFKIYNPEPRHGAHGSVDSAMETIMYGSMFTNKILSYGTFSWWIGYLNNKNNIMIPNPKDFKSGASNAIFKPMDKLCGWKFI